VIKELNLIVSAFLKLSIAFAKIASSFEEVVFAYSNPNLAAPLRDT
jgi:hypothetical protein